MAAQERQYGLWDSPISVDFLSDKSTSYDGIQVHPGTGNKYLLEGRSNGKNVIVEISNSDSADILPSDYSVLAKVHEYGGGAYTLDASRNRIIFSNQSDQGVYTLDLASGDVAAIVQRDGWRFADFDIHPQGWIACIREVHDLENDVPQTVVNELVLLDPTKKEAKPLVSGNDFYSNVRFSPDGTKVCWMEWKNPEMPWTGSQLFLATFDSTSGNISGPKLLAGTGKERSVSQPRWGPDGTLFFADDVNSYWQLYKLSPGLDKPEKVLKQGLENADHADAEFRLGSYTYLPLSPDRLILTYHQHGRNLFAEINTVAGTYQDVDLPIAHLLSMAKVSSNEFAIIGTPSTHSTGLYAVQLTNSTPSVTLLKRSVELNIPEAYISTGEHLSFPRKYGNYLEGEVHGFLLPPQNPAFRAPTGTLPPLIVFAHGGPTGYTRPALTLEAQFWTSRGYAVFQLNYGGSTGYGRAYRTLLDGRWGALDSGDAGSAAAGLAAAGRVDPSRRAVYGASAGGYIALKSPIDCPDVWAAAVSLFGIADTKPFATTTHKFEGCYADALLWGTGVVPSEEEKERVHVERSPVHHVAKIQAPMLILQGDLDRVVPPDQAHMMDKALRENGKISQLEIFEGEAHTMWRGEARRRMTKLMQEWLNKYLIRSE